MYILTGWRKRVDSVSLAEPEVDAHDDACEHGVRPVPPPGLVKGALLQLHAHPGAGFHAQHGGDAAVPVAAGGVSEHLRLAVHHECQPEEEARHEE